METIFAKKLKLPTHSTELELEVQATDFQECLNVIRNQVEEVDPSYWESLSPVEEFRVIQLVKKQFFS